MEKKGKDTALWEYLPAPWRTMLASREPLMVVLRGVMALFLVVFWILSFRRVWTSLLPGNFYQRDLYQEYVMAKAALTGIDPYLPTNKLAEIFLPHLPVAVFTHPSPHPPAAVFLGVPLTLVTYEQAVVAWFILGLIWVLLLATLLLKGGARCSDWKKILVFALILLVWEPVVWDFALGQSSVFLLVLLTGAWLFLRDEHDIKGGFLIGAAIALKLTFWPIAILLAVQKRWPAVVTVAGVVLVVNLAASLWLGGDTVLSYYLKIGPGVSWLYRSYDWNTSIWSVAWRLFEGMENVRGVGGVPLWYAPQLAPWAAIFFSLVLVVIGMTLAMRSATFDGAFGIMVCVSILVNPTSWVHYFSWAIIPLLVLVFKLIELEAPRKETRLAIWIGLLLVFLWYVIYPLIRLLNGVLQGLTSPMVISSLTYMVMYTPTFTILGLMALLARVDRMLSLKNACSVKGRAISNHDKRACCI